MEARARHTLVAPSLRHLKGAIRGSARVCTSRRRCETMSDMATAVRSTAVA